MSASPQAHPNGRQKKNSIGSWFSKKFGKKGNDGAVTSSESPDYSPANGTVPARKAPTTASNDVENKSSGLNEAPRPNHVTGASPAIGAPQPQFASAFASNQAHGLAKTLTVPQNEASTHARLNPPPQLDGIPVQEPLGTIDLPRSPRPDASSNLTDQDPGSLSPSTVTSGKPIEAAALHGPEQPVHPGATGSPGTGAMPEVAPPILGAIISAGTTSLDGVESQVDDASSFSGRDSIGNRTTDTAKSRASTKPTTLMSLDTREPTVLPTTHIAQPRQSNGGDSLGNSPRYHTGPRESSAIHFAPEGVSRSGSGPIANNGSTIGDGGSTFVTVPTFSRPHPNNNPHPASVPADNASVLTLASSTAGMSLGGASRSHHHAPSLGGARSIGGSLMGDRRNSSDTYASLKALPPLSRRGSDSSSRTRDSVAASSTGQNSHQAMYTPGVVAAPGAPSDRVSLHRTPSQKTVATQLSVPLSASASNPALQAYAKSEHTPNGSQLHLAGVGGGSQTAHITAEPESGDHQQHDEAALTTGQVESHEDTDDKATAAPTRADLSDPQLTVGTPSTDLLEAQARNLAATEHDQTLHEAAQPAQHDSSAQGEALEIKEQEPFDVPGGPPVA